MPPDFEFAVCAQETDAVSRYLHAKSLLNDCSYGVTCTDPDPVFLVVPPRGGPDDAIFQTMLTSELLTFAKGLHAGWHGHIAQIAAQQSV